MPMPNLTVPQFPNVPDLPGVPALLRTVGAPVLASANAVLINAGLGQFALGLSKPVWGVFDASGNPVAVSDSVVDLDFKADSRISNYPQEAGAFASYNKVQTPNEARVQLACGGTVAARTAFLNAIDAAKQSTNLYSIVTPEATYLSMNIVAYDYRRESRNGANLLLVSLHIEEVRVNARAQFSQSGASTASSATDTTSTASGSTTSVGTGAPSGFGSASALPADQVQNPASADPVSQGQVQAPEATPAQTAVVEQQPVDGVNYNSGAIWFDGKPQYGGLK